MINLVLSFLILISAEEIQFSRQNLRFENGVTLKVQVAKSEEQKAKGLMDRVHLAEGEGMIFLFSPPQRLSFWMKNTLIPLSIGFFDEKKKLLEMKEMSPSPGPVSDSNLPRYESSNPAAYALEVPQGWFQRHKIKVGTKFKFTN